MKIILNTMILTAMPLGFLTPPNYIGGQPMYVTYGGIGSTLAHEITHGFDASGKIQRIFVF